MSQPVPGTALLIVLSLLSLCGCQSPSRFSQANANRSSPLTADQTADAPSKGDAKTDKARSGQSSAPVASRSMEDIIRDGKQQEYKAALTEQSGNTQQARTQWLQARTTYQAALAQDPNRVEVHHRLAVIADQLQEYATADVHYQAALKAKGNDADLLCDVGYSLLLRGRYDESERYLRKALDAKPGHKRTLNNLGLLYGKQGQYDQALAMFRRGGTEQEAQRNIQKLFPSGPPQIMAGTSGASGSATNGPPSMDSERRGAAPPLPDIAEMTPRQLKQAMDQKRNEAIAARTQRDQATNTTPPAWQPQFTQNQSTQNQYPQHPSAQNQFAQNQFAQGVQPTQPQTPSPNWPRQPANGPAQPSPWPSQGQPPAMAAMPTQPAADSGSAAANGDELDRSTSLRNEFARIDRGTTAAPMNSTPPTNPTGSNPPVRVSSANPLDSMPFFEGTARGTASNVQTASGQADGSNRDVQQAVYNSPQSRPQAQGNELAGFATPRTGGTDNAGLLAARLGMNAGPGQMFPMMPANNPPGASSPPPGTFPADQLRTSGAEFAPTNQYPMQQPSAQMRAAQPVDPHSVPAAPHLMNGPNTGQFFAQNTPPAANDTAPTNQPPMNPQANYSSPTQPAASYPQPNGYGPAASNTANDALEAYQAEINRHNSGSPTWPTNTRPLNAPAASPSWQNDPRMLPQSTPQTAMPTQGYYNR